MAFDQSKYIADFIKENYDRIDVKIPKGKRAILKEIATKQNITDNRGRISVSRLFVEAVEEKYKIDLSKPE